MGPGVTSIQMLSTPLLSRRLPTTTALLSLLLVSALVMLGAGCSGEDARTGPPDDGWGPGDGDGSGGDGGKGGGGGAGKGDGGDGGAGGNGGDAGESDAGDASPDGDVEYPPADVACEWDVAFRSNGLSFIFPTAQALGHRIGAFLVDPDEHRFVLALRGSKGKSADGAISAAVINAGLYSFPGASKKPTMTSFSLAQGRFESGTQTTGFLNFRDEEKEISLHLTDIQVSSFTQAGCQQILATVDATLPANPANAGTQIRSGGSLHTLADLAGMKDGKGNYTNVPIRFLMVGEATSFDFASL